ncbi:hypothetical protein ACS3UN_12865 [Oscillospiraceae bacterium LTW-04]|nr:hypothetical protein RBH76_00675 [Oscillospiraceae bacterium MB24-C1]
MNRSLFRKSSIQRISAPEQLNDYIRVSNPSAFLVLGAIIILFVSLITWGIMGSLPTSIATVGIVKDEKLLCYVPSDEAAKINVGMSVKMRNDVIGTVRSISRIPMSAEEVAVAIDSDYIVNVLSLSDWNTEVKIDTPEPDVDKIYKLSIITDEIRPIDFLLN